MDSGLERLVELLWASLPPRDATDRSERLDECARHLLPRLGDLDVAELAGPRAFELFEQVGRRLLEHRQNRDAERLMVLALAASGGDEIAAPIALQGLGVALQQQGAQQRLRAIELYRDVDRRVRAGPERADDLEITNIASLVFCLHENGDIAAARVAFEQSLPQLRRHEASHPLAVGSVYNNIAYAALESEPADLDLARRACVMAMRTWGAHLPKRDPYIGAAVQCMARIEEEARQFERAERRYRQAIRIRQRRLGPFHAWVAYGYHDLAVLLGRLGRIDEAIEFADQALAIRRDRVDSAEELALGLCLSGRLRVDDDPSAARDRCDQAQRIHPFECTHGSCPLR